MIRFDKLAKGLVKFAGGGGHRRSAASGRSHNPSGNPGTGNTRPGRHLKID